MIASAGALLLGISMLAVASPAMAGTSAESVSSCSVNYETKDHFCVEGDVEALKDALLKEKNVVLVDADAGGRAQVSAARASASRAGDIQPTANYVLGVAFDDTNYGGRTIVFNTSISTTCSTHSFSWDDLRYAYWSGFGWAAVDNQIESVQPGPGCQMWMYVDYNRTGSVFKATGPSSTLNWANNLSSSIWFTG